MKSHQFRFLAITCILFVSLLYGTSSIVYGMSSDKQLLLVTRSRAPLADDSGRYRVVQNKVQWDPKQTAIIICDMWNEHWCKGATKRVAELAPYMNDVISKARDKGVLIIHSPSGTIGAYADHPARKCAESG